NHRQDFSALRVFGDGCARLVHIVELVLCRLLKVQIQREYNVLALDRRDLIQVANGPATAVADHSLLAVFAPQYLVVILLDAALADYVACFVSSLRKLGVFQLFGADLTNVPQYLSSKRPEFIKALRLGLYLDFGMLVFVARHPCSI